MVLNNALKEREMIENWIGFYAQFDTSFDLFCALAGEFYSQIRERKSDVSLSLLFGRGSERERVCLMRVLYVHFCLRRLSNKERAFYEDIGLKMASLLYSLYIC